MATSSERRWQCLDTFPWQHQIITGGEQVMTKYNTKKIRKLLTDGFTPDELRRFCYDEKSFRDIYEQLPPTPGKGEIIDQLIEHAERKVLFKPLLIWAKDTKPAKYAEYEPYADDPFEDFNSIRQAYRDYLIKELKDHIIRGFAPQVGGKVLSLPLAKIFLPLQAVEGRPALAEYAEEDLLRQAASEIVGELPLAQSTVSEHLRILKDAGL
jgi:DNA-binding transcriptional ArsR family regulator